MATRPYLPPRRVCLRGAVAAAAGSIALVLGTIGCARLSPFVAASGQQQVAGKSVRAPYASTINYFGYVPPGTHLQEQFDGHRAWVLQLWLPATTQELGIRAVSGVRRLARPRLGLDTVDPAYIANRDSEVTFEPAIRLERCLAAINPQDLDRPCGQWVPLGVQQEAGGGEEGGSRTQATLRVMSSNDDPLKVLVRGLYRIVVHSANIGEVQGTLLVQVGAPGDLERMHLAGSLTELASAVRSAATGSEASRSAPAPAETLPAPVAPQPASSPTPTPTASGQ